MNVMSVRSEHVQYEVGPKGGSFMPATDPVNQRSGPSEFLDLSVYLLIWVGTPNDVQRPHFGISETVASAA